MIEILLNVFILYIIYMCVFVNIVVDIIFMISGKD